MKKKLLLALFVMLFGVMAFVNMTASAETYGDLTYTISDGEVTITDCDESATGEMIIPDTIDGYPVTSIGSAFYGCTGLSSITIPDSVTHIGSRAFSDCTKLTSVTIPDSVTFIGEHAFYGCTGLTNVTIGNSVTSIGDFAFSDCEDLTSVTIGNSVTYIGYQTFFCCAGLSSITIPDSVTSIGDYAFSGCTGLTSINVSNRNTEYSSQDGVLFNKSKTELICYPAGKKDTSYIIPDSVTSIGFRAFSNCAGLTSIIIPNSVTSIESMAFIDCTKLTSVTIPDSVTHIVFMAFRDCTSLTDIYYSGTEEEWNAIEIGEYNEPLLNATIHFESNGSPEEPTYTPGDINGDGAVDVRDVITLRRFIAGGYGIEVAEEIADINKDDNSDVRDVITLRRFIAGGYGIEL